MTGQPSEQIFWLASRAFGIVAIVTLALSVGLGLAMSGRIVRRPGLPAKLRRYHEALTLVTLALVAAHGALLLADGYLRPGLAGITLPFQMSYRPLWTGLGIIGAWLAVILGLSFYVRRWIGAATWRRLHRWVIAVYVLALAHTIGAGTDGRSDTMLVLLAVLTTPIVFGFAYRMLAASGRRAGKAAPVAAPAAVPVARARDRALLVPPR